MRWLLVIWLVLGVAARAQEAPVDVPLADVRAEAQAQAVMAELRCLQCQNQSIADSHAAQAAAMRAIVRQQVAAGASPDAVRSWFVERYGPWVSFDPPARSDTALLWAAPLLLLVAGVFAAARLFGRRR
jgi:cytochrome c-type biogenesis protein CcmH